MNCANKYCSETAGRCQCCGCTNEFHVHHICPRSSLGDDAVENLITLCTRCHRTVHGRN
ncbi:MAG: HNH endonuclease [Candidatus Sulfotelmatobacter sp.]